MRVQRIAVDDGTTLRLGAFNIEPEHCRSWRPQLCLRLTWHLPSSGTRSCGRAARPDPRIMSDHLAKAPIAARDFELAPRAASRRTSTLKRRGVVVSAGC